MGCYSFTVRDFHSLLLTGLRRRTVWQKETDKLRYRVSLKRSYKDGDDWKNSDQLAPIIHDGDGI